jgi:hypothetical protein
MKTIITVIVSLCCILLSPPAIHADEGQQPSKTTGEKHISIAGDCGVCHHQHGKNAALPCGECHSVKASTFKATATGGFIACKNCHGAYDPATPQMPGLKVAYHRQCFECHRGMGEVGVNPKGCALMCHDKRDQKVGLKANKSR